MAANPASILDSVKKNLGFDPEYQAFDLDILTHINSAFGDLQQMGVGADTGFVISDNTIVWDQYVTDLSIQSLIRLYICMKTKLGFDPPVTSFAIDAVQKQIEELGFRINLAAEHLSPPAPPADVIVEEGWVPVIVRLQYAAVVTPIAVEGNMFYLTLTGDCTINAPVSGTDGQHITLDLTSNGHAVTWGPGWNFGSAGLPALSPGGKSDVISAYYRESSAEWFAGYTPGF
jgi:hypothetical protein